MRNSEKKKQEIVIFTNGINQDVNQELHDSIKGFYFDAQNMRMDSKNFNKYVLSKINGEEVLYTNDEGVADYKCIGVSYIATPVITPPPINQANTRGHIIEIWADKNENANALMIIDGKIMVDNDKFDVKWNYPLQIDKNESCIGGEIFFTDDRVAPYIFNIKSIIDAYNNGDTTYTTGFNINLYITQLQIPLDHPVLEKLRDVEGGMDVGMYSYSIRFVDADGNRTAFSSPTPFIPLPEKYKTSGQYPDISYGDDAGNSSLYNIQIKFRVNNVSHQYDYVELKRVKFVNGLGLGDPPTVEWIKVTTLVNGTEANYDLPEAPEYQVFIWEDDTTRVWLPLSSEEDSYKANMIETAKSIRYYHHRLVLGNYKIVSKDIEDDLLDKLYEADFNMTAHELNKSGSYWIYAEAKDVIGNEGKL